jgi:hypothetical protein
MVGLLTLLYSFVSQVASLTSLLRQLPKGAALRLMLAIAAYLVHGAIGLVLLIYCRPHLSTTPIGATGAVAALFGWFALGLHGLLALIPVTGDGQKPGWATRLGIYDVVCLLVIGAGITTALR